MVIPEKSELARKSFSLAHNLDGSGRIWEYCIPYPTPTGNKNGRGVWQQAARIARQGVQDMSMVIMAVGKKPSEPLKKWGLVVHRVGPGPKMLDDDNLRAGFKPFRDGIVRSGVAQDDKPSALTFTHYSQEVDRRQEKQCTWVWVVEFPDKKKMNTKPFLIIPAILAGILLGCENTAAPRFYKCVKRADETLSCRDVYGSEEAIRKAPGILCEVKNDGYFHCENGDKYEVK